MTFSVVSAYLIGVIVTLSVLLISCLVSNLIPISFETSRPDIRNRRVWFWVLSVLTPILVMVIAWLFVYSDLKVPTQKVSYMTAMCISAALSFALYLILGFVLSKLLKTTKIGGWF